ncbi:MAG: DUF1801 domain-containing protein [Parvularculaceae bacterium]|nr:DUF1801 domain-containing protein [Parvularculaceae bacterium]
MPVKKKTLKKKATKKKATAKTSGKKAAPKKSAEMKTKPTARSVEDFIAAVPGDQRRKDAKAALTLMKKWTGLKPKMWGPSIIGFGSYHYKYDSGREGDMCMTGFSPRAGAIVFYVMGGAPESDPLFKKLGKYKTGKSCLYINRLDDVDLSVLEAIVKKSIAYMKKTYPTAP